MRITNLTVPVSYITTVTTSGTPVRVSSGDSIPVPDGSEIIILAHPDNTGFITMAESSTNALNTSTRHIRLAANQSMTRQLKNLNMMYFDATVSGDKVIVSVDI